MSLEPIVRYSRNVEGKITIATIFLCVLVVSVFFLLDVQYKEGIRASDVATTSVFVLNSPPEWTTGPAEVPASGTSSPTNEGDEITWSGTAYDPNGSNSYWLLICKNTTATETDMIIYEQLGEGSLPDCPGGESGRWARSVLTGDGLEATATYNVPEGRVLDEVNDWYAFICDNDSINPRCNVTDIRQEPYDVLGDPDPSMGGASPFYVNYRPMFTEFNSPAPVDPGVTATWTTVASNTNTVLTDLRVRLFVCRANDFDENALECGVGGTYASSTLVASDPDASYDVTIPTPNGDYDAYGFVVDAYGLSAPLSTNTAYSGEDRMQATSAQLTVNNVAPSLEVDSVMILNYDDDPNHLTVDVPEGETEGFQVSFTTRDNNSCVTSSWPGSGTTTGFQEMESVAVNIFRSGIGMNNCLLYSDYNANNCYPFAVASSTYEADGKGWDMLCTRVDSSCTGNTDPTVEWECTFPLWYLADPTDGSLASEVQFPGEEWLASVVVTDVDSATSTLAQGTDGIDVQRYTAFRLEQNSIVFGQLEAGQRNALLDRATPIVATGNTGVDQDLRGTPMCPEFDVGAPDYGCSSYVHTNPGDVPPDTIPARFQRFAEGLTTSYGEGLELMDIKYDDYINLELNVSKATVVPTPPSKSIGWGIEIPSQITIAGEYRGENTFMAVISDATAW